MLLLIEFSRPASCFITPISRFIDPYYSSRLRWSPLIVEYSNLFRLPTGSGSISWWCSTWYVRHGPHEQPPEIGIGWIRLYPLTSKHPWNPNPFQWQHLEFHLEHQSSRALSCSNLTDSSFTMETIGSNIASGLTWFAHLLPFLVILARELPGWDRSLL